MPFVPSDLQLLFLDDNNSATGQGGSTTDWPTYKTNLRWREWGRRTNNSSTPGDKTYSEYDGDLNLSMSFPSRFLRGRYDSAGVGVSGNNLSKDYLIDNADPALLGVEPLWQYTWVAIQNRNVAVNANCLKLGVQGGFSPPVNFGNNDYISNSQQYVAVRWMGRLSGSDISVLNGLLTTNGGSGYYNFPHIVEIEQADTGFNYWNAFGTGVNSKWIYRQQNNSQRYAYPTVSHNPWQIVQWIGRDDNNIGGRYGHIFDIPPNTTLLGIMIITKDSAGSQYGNSDLGGIYPQPPYSWKVSEVEIKLEYLV